MQVELLKKEGIKSFADCVKECVLVEGRHAGDGDVCVQSVKVRFVREWVCLSLINHDRLWNRIEVSDTVRYLLHEQIVYATQGFGAERNMINSFVLIGDETDEEEKICVGKVLWVFPCVVGEGGKAAMRWPFFL